eukprot:scaffold172050_cov73-Attheya_sp.AAC.3
MLVCTGTQPAVSNGNLNDSIDQELVHYLLAVSRYNCTRYVSKTGTKATWTDYEVGYLRFLSVTIVSRGFNRVGLLLPELTTIPAPHGTE